MSGDWLCNPDKLSPLDTPVNDSLLTYMGEGTNGHFTLVLWRSITFSGLYDLHAGLRQVDVHLYPDALELPRWKQRSITDFLDFSSRQIKALSVVYTRFHDVK